jgi:hypothetical protein
VFTTTTPDVAVRVEEAVRRGSPRAVALATPTARTLTTAAATSFARILDINPRTSRAAKRCVRIVGTAR